MGNGILNEMPGQGKLFFSGPFRPQFPFFELKGFFLLSKRVKGPGGLGKSGNREGPESNKKNAQDFSSLQHESK